MRTIENLNVNTEEAKKRRVLSRHCCVSSWILGSILGSGRLDRAIHPSGILPGIDWDRRLRRTSACA